MSTGWTAEKLGALPEGTVIEVEHQIGPNWVGPVRYILHREESTGLTWRGTGGRFFLITEISDTTPIRVVSVPIDALLADETVWVAEDAFVSTTHLAGSIRDEAETVLRAAIEHITGETTT